MSVALLTVIALLRQPLLQRAEVLDHAVVDERQHAVAADVRMSVLVGRRAVRRPARVADADARRAPAASSAASASSSTRPAVFVIAELAVARP